MPCKVKILVFLGESDILAALSQFHWALGFWSDIRDAFCGVPFAKNSPRGKVRLFKWWEMFKQVWCDDFKVILERFALQSFLDFESFSEIARIQIVVGFRVSSVQRFFIFIQPDLKKVNHV